MTSINKFEFCIVNQKVIVKGRVKNWIEFLNEQQLELTENKRPLVDILGITEQLFEYKMKYLVGINSDYDERKKEMRAQCEKILSSFLINSLQIADGKDPEKLKATFDSVIEFCLRTEMEEFLFTQLKEMMKIEFKIWDKFMISLEEWIEDKQISKIPNSQISEIIDFFNQNQKYHTL